MLKGPNVLVVGATGFLGRSLVRALERRGCATYRLHFQDRRTTDGPGQALHSVSSQVADIEAAVAGTDWDCVYHLAAAGVSPSERQPADLMEGNLGLLSRVLTAFAGRPPRRFVYTGSCAEYSRAEAPNRINEFHPTLPVNLYGAAKAAAGIWGAALAKRLAMPFVLARLFHFYGPGEASSRLVPYLLHCLRQGVQAQLTGGEQVRDLLYVDDVADALITIGTAPTWPESVYNVCSGEAISIREIGETAARTIGGAAGLLRFGALPYRPDEEMWIVGDNTRLVHHFGWAPQTSLEQGLMRLADAAGIPVAGVVDHG